MVVGDGETLVLAGGSCRWPNNAIVGRSIRLAFPTQFALMAPSHVGVVLGADQSLSLLNQMLWAVLTIAAPVVAVVMIVGLIVSVLQVATQLQEMTLSYIPKLLAAVLVLIAVGPWMIERMTHFAVEAIRTIPSIG